MDVGKVPVQSRFAKDLRGSLASDLFQRFRTLNVWKARDKRAPHKPLLALWAIGRCLRGEGRLASYDLVDRELAGLLRRFGPHRRTIHTEDPFWRMQRDNVWEVDRPRLVRSNKGGGAYKSDLRRHQILGGLTEADYIAFRNDPALATRVAEYLVACHFPPTLQDEILETTGILGAVTKELEVREVDELVTVRRRRRDPAFRRLVLDAYGSRCAVCEFAVRRDNVPLAIEAAHVKWHEASGPAVVENGLALCSLHHELFDTGAFTLLPQLTVFVADAIKGTGADSALWRYHGAPLRARPTEELHLPAPRFLAWHRSEVSKDPEAVR